MQARALTLALLLAAGCAKPDPKTSSPGPPAGAEPSPPAPVPKHWEGLIALPGGQPIEFFASFDTGPDRAHAGTMDIPAQGARALPLHGVSLEAERLIFELGPPINAKWDCRRTGDEATCVFEQHGTQLEAQMEAITAEEFADATRVSRPQTPTGPFPYRSEEVEYRNDPADVRLAGTLTLPAGEGPHPAVILISGSGPQDRDETIFEHKPFWVLADHLSRQGIAVLRVDDRGVGKSTGNLDASTSEDFAGDVLAGVAYLAGRAEVDGRRIGLIGHSEGGLIAPMAATRSGQVAFVVLLAGPGVPGREILDHQGRLIAEKSGAGPELIEHDSRQRQRMFEILRSNPDDAAAAEQLVVFYRGQLDELPAAKKTQLGDLDKVARAQVAGVATPWFRFFLDYDPRPTLRKVKVPVLVLSGEKDLQVDPEQNVPAIAKALKKARNRDVTVEVLPGLNHLFQTASRGTPDEYARIEETFDPVALERISSWIAARTLGRAR